MLLVNEENAIVQPRNGVATFGNATSKFSIMCVQMVSFNLH
jgi:hypothetical protein